MFMNSIQGPKSSKRPVSSVESLLIQNGLQKFVKILLDNGYDDLGFLSEVPEDELQEIGIINPTDREKVSSHYYLCVM